MEFELPDFGTLRRMPQYLQHLIFADALKPGDEFVDSGTSFQIFKHRAYWHAATAKNPDAAKAGEVSLQCTASRPIHELPRESHKNASTTGQRIRCKALHNHSLRLPRPAHFNRANPPYGFAQRFEFYHRSLRIRSRNDHRHANAAIEHAMHFGIGHIAVLL